MARHHIWFPKQKTKIPSKIDKIQTNKGNLYKYILTNNDERKV